MITHVTEFGGGVLLYVAQQSTTLNATDTTKRCQLKVNAKRMTFMTSKTTKKTSQMT